ncbi:MAG: zinc-ribbon domain-containing protein [Clostridia bacterium]|nr:zinc-ribbon domain-containing protein [Clostridia bacterium]
MEFWDEVYKKISDAANFTAKETGKMTEMAKVKFNILREKSKLDDAYKEMGEIYYTQMKTSEYDDKKITVAYDKIEKSIVEIERLTTLLGALSNTTVCSGCGKKVEKGTPFCSQCGTKIEEDSEDKTEENTEE